MAIDIKKVAVLGVGTLGAQIAAQSAAVGYQVFVYDPDPEVYGRTMKDLLAVDQSKVLESPIDLSKWATAGDVITFCGSLAEACSQADLVVEVVPENLELKLKIWAEIEASAPAEAILATNSSSMPVSKMEGAVSHPERCLNLHFYRMELGQNMADVMGGSKTTPEIIEVGREFIRSLGCIPLKVKKELLGFCFNRVWRAIKRETLYMWAGDFVDFRDIDRAWMKFTGTPWGPFGLMDAVGLDVVRDIENVYYKESGLPHDAPPQALNDKVAKGELGVKSGQGFYSYPNPEYQDPDFLKP